MREGPCEGGPAGKIGPCRVEKAGSRGCRGGVRWGGSGNFKRNSERSEGTPSGCGSCRKAGEGQAQDRPYIQQVCGWGLGKSGVSV